MTKESLLGYFIFDLRNNIPSVIRINDNSGEYAPTTTTTTSPLNMISTKQHTNKQQHSVSLSPDRTNRSNSRNGNMIGSAIGTSSSSNHHHTSKTPHHRTNFPKSYAPPVLVPIRYEPPSPRHMLRRYGVVH